MFIGPLVTGLIIIPVFKLSSLSLISFPHCRYLLLVYGYILPYHLDLFYTPHLLSYRPNRSNIIQTILSTSYTRTIRPVSKSHWMITDKATAQICNMERKYAPKLRSHDGVRLYHLRYDGVSVPVGSVVLGPRFVTVPARVLP